MVDGIGNIGKLHEITYFEKTSLSSTKNTDNSSSIFSTAKSALNNNVTGEGSDITDIIQEKTAVLFEKSLSTDKLKEGSKIKDALKGSKVPNMELVGNTIETELKSISKNIIRILDSSMSRLQSCQSEADVDKVIKDIEQEVQNEKNKISAYVKRGQKAVELEKVLAPIYTDPAKENAAKNIDIDKITQDILSTPDIEEAKNTSEPKGENKILQNAKNSIDEDKVSQGLDDLIKYIKTGEKDDKNGKLGEYIPNDNTPESLNQQKNNSSNNFFNQFVKKNPLV